MERRTCMKRNKNRDKDTQVGKWAGRNERAKSVFPGTNFSTITN